MSSGSEKDRVSEEIENGSGKIHNKPKRVALFRLTKAKNRLQRKRKDKKDLNSNSSSVGCFGKRVLSGGGGGCCCLRSFQKESNSGSPTTSDPNSTEFTHDSLRGLIETNDFYSKECNCHKVVDDDG